MFPSDKYSFIVKHKRDFEQNICYKISKRHSNVDMQTIEQRTTLEAWRNSQPAGSPHIRLRAWARARQPDET